MTPLAARSKALVAIALAWAAGFVDIVTWLALAHVYSSHMTGNTAGFAHGLGAAKWIDAFHHGWPILPFLGGLLYSAATTKIARRNGIHSSFSIALFTELLLLAAFLAIGTRHIRNGEVQVTSQWLYYTILSLPCAAMGIQTVTVTRVNGLRVYTTYLTGSLSKFSENVIEYIFWWKDEMRRPRPRRLRLLSVALHQKALQHAALTGGLWVAFFAGAICGVLEESRYALICLVGPIAVLAVTIVIDVLWPVAAADEPPEIDSAH